MRPATATPSYVRQNAGLHSARPVAPNPGAFDPEIARLFQELRSFLRLSVPDVAMRLRTEPHVIAFLEAGRVDLLPPWAETSRVVNRYGALAGIDPSAVLQRLAVQPAHVLQPQPAAPAPAERIVQRLTGRVSGEPGRAAGAGLEALGAWGLEVGTAASRLADWVRGARHPVRWVLGVAVALLLVASTASSGMLQASVGGLSSPISGLLRTLSDQLTLASTPVREGHRWIEVDDPRRRRGDKLPSPRS